VPVKKKKKDPEELRRRRHAREQEHREWVEAEIAKLEQMNLSPKDLQERLLDLGLWSLKFPADQEFFYRRLHELGREIKDADEVLRAVLDELLVKNIPIGPHMHAWVRHVGRFSKDSGSDPKVRRAAAEDMLKKDLINELGMTAADANKYVAECQGVTSNAIKQRRFRMKRKRDPR
jgi:hypothetical protein